MNLLPWQQNSSCTQTKDKCFLVQLFSDFSYENFAVSILLPRHIYKLGLILGLEEPSKDESTQISIGRAIN